MEDLLVLHYFYWKLFGLVLYKKIRFLRLQDACLHNILYIWYARPYVVQTIDYSMQGIVSVQNAVFQRYTKLL